MPSATQFQGIHGQHHVGANGLTTSSSVSDLSSPYSPAVTILPHHIKPHCSFQQPWETAGPQQQQLHHQAATNGSSQYKYSRSLMRDVSFSSTMELESCVNAGNYTNVHFESSLEVMGGGQNAGSALDIFHPGEELSGREDSLDLYSTFREDSYSENSDDFSNESGENRFPPAVGGTAIINNGHSPIEMNFMPQNGNGVNPVRGLMEASAGLSGRSSQTEHNHYAVTPYYGHASTQQAQISTQHHGCQPMHQSYHHHLNTFSLSHQLGQTQQQYHHTHSTHENNQPLFNHSHTGNHIFPEPLPSIYPDLTASRAAYMKATTTSYTNGFVSITNHLTPSSSYPGNGVPVVESNKEPSNFVELAPATTTTTTNARDGVDSGLDSSIEEGDCRKNNAPAYADLSTVTSYTKLEPFTEILQGAAKGECKNGLQSLHQISRVDDDIDSKVTEIEPESHFDDDSVTENFGEIIKKSMVETVSA